MRLRDTIICFVCVIITIAMLFMAGSKLDYINSARKEMKLIINEPLENAPPSLAFATVAMGAFRGLVVDILWIRADRLKQQGQFFDAKQLADWITTLQPRFISVWDFHSWNMAYNISHAIPIYQPEERWRWVKNGYELLRDEAIVRNPNSMELYRSLAFIFQHKIGGPTDDAHKYYKLQLLLAMKPLLGPQTNDYYQKLAEAPVELSQVLKDSEVANFLAELRSADVAFEDEKQLVSNYLSLRQLPERFSPDAFDVIDKWRQSQALEKFDVFAKSYHLRNEWKLEPELMHELNLMYGPVDWDDPNNRYPLNWEHADSHAIYWAAKSIKVSGKSEFSVDQLNLDRIIYFGLKDLFRYGKIIIYDVPVELPPDPNIQEAQGPVRTVMKTVFVRPDLRMFEPYNRANLDLIKKYEELGENIISLKDGHRNIVSNAIVSFYQAGHIGYAQKQYNQLKQLYERKEFKVSLPVFVRNQLAEELEYLDIHEATEIIQMLLLEAYFRYAVRDDDEAFGRERMAREVYDNAQKQFSTEKTARITLPEFEVLRYLALDSFLQDEMYPVYMRQSLLARIQIERPRLYKKLERQRDAILEKIKNAEK